MSSRAAWLAWLLSLALTALSLLLLTLNLSHHGIPPFYYWLEATALAVGYSTVGAVVASRLPKSFVGWLFCTIGLLFGVPRRQVTRSPLAAGCLVHRDPGPVGSAAGGFLPRRGPGAPLR